MKLALLVENGFAIVLPIVISMLITDTMINQVSDFLAPQLISNFGIALFTSFVVIFGISQYFILSYSRKKLRYRYAASLSTKIMDNAIVIVQIFLVLINLVILVQILFLSRYYTFLLIIMTVVSYSAALGAISYFAYKFLSWYFVNKHSLIVLLYGISFALLSLISLMGLGLDLYNFGLKPPEIYPTTSVEFPSYEEGTILNSIDLSFQYLDLVSFVIVWGSSALLLREYIHKWRLRHWVLICVPLVYFLGSFVDYTGLYVPTSDSELFSYYLYSSLNSTAGGLLFAFAFLLVARNIHSVIIKNYMELSAYGFVLLFISNQVFLVASSFPPFGTVTISFYGLASYLIVRGLYASAVSVSQDVVLRKSIKRSIIRRSELLGSIGQAEMHQQTEKWVKDVDKRDLKSDIPSSMTREEVVAYIQETVNEVSKLKRKNNSV
ncbi:MAG: hypothetical protein ABJB85_07240 [Nitrososphaerota archaeon]